MYYKRNCNFKFTILSQSYFFFFFNFFRLTAFQPESFLKLSVKYLGKVIVKKLCANLMTLQTFREKLKSSQREYAPEFCSLGFQRNLYSAILSIVIMNVNSLCMLNQGRLWRPMSGFTLPFKNST